MPSKHPALTALALSVALAFAAVPAEAAKIAVKKEADLPRFSYAIPGPASKFVEADDAAFGVFAAQVSRDIDKTLAEYQVDDHSMLGELLSARLDAQELSHDYAGGLKTIEQLRALEDKPAAKLISGLYARARLQAAIDAGAESGPAYETAFKKHYAEAIAPLPWAIVQDSIKSAYGSSQLASRALMLGHVQSELDPAAAKSGALDAGEARELLEARIYLKEFLPISAARAEVLHAYIAKNQVSPPEIWSAREVTLTAADKTTPVNVGIWDSGVDVALFPDQLFTDDHPVHWDGPLARIAAACETILALDPETVVPGHGPVMTPQDVRDYVTYLRRLEALVHTRHAAGVPAGEAAADILDTRFYDHLGLPERIVILTAVEYRHLDGETGEPDLVGLAAQAAGWAFARREVAP